MKTDAAAALVASLLAHATAQADTVGGNWTAIVDRLDSLAYEVRQAARAGRDVPDLAEVSAAVLGKVGQADVAVAALESVLRTMELAQ